MDGSGVGESGNGGFITFGGTRRVGGGCEVVEGGGGADGGCGVGNDS